MNQTDLASELNNHIGTSAYHHNHYYPWLKYTDGVESFAQHAGNGAYWFLDIIGTELKQLATEQDFLCITLKSESFRGHIIATDGNDKILYQKKIPFTDCPTGDYTFFLTNSVMMLSSEY
jgi:hypothetical protein